MNDLGKDKVGTLLIKLATPAIIAQLVYLLYNIVDRIFIGRIENGDLAMAGVGVSLPIIMLITAFSLMFGMGGAPRAAIKMGQGDHEGAERIMTNSLVMLIIISIILTALFLFFGEKLLWLFGASELTIGYAKDYLLIYVSGTIFVQLAMGMNPFIHTQGFAKIGMTTILIGAIINIILDPILIFGFNLGVKGAAIATVISQAISAIWVMYFLCSFKSKLKLRKQFIRLDWPTIGSVVSLGISPFIMNSTESLVLIALNTQLLAYGGDIAVGAMTIIVSIIQLIILPLQGLGQGLQPIVSYNYGAQQMDRVRKTIRLALTGGMIYTVLFCTILMLIPSAFVKIFNNDPNLISTTSQFIRIYFIGIFIFGSQVICQQIFIALGQAKVSLFIAILRKVILLIPLVYILPPFFDQPILGVLTAEPVSDILSALTTLTLFALFYRKHLQKSVAP